MSFTATVTELRARALTDLRMGLPVVLIGDENLLIFACETISDTRLKILSQSPDAMVCITDWRAKTLKIPAYDGDLARVRLPKDVTQTWVQAMADPTLDMQTPMKGPFDCLRAGSVDSLRLGISLAKDAHLLPAIVAAPVKEFDPSLTVLPTSVVANTGLMDVAKSYLPIAAAEKTRLTIFRPIPGGEEHYAIEIGNPDRDEAVLTRLHSACFTGDVLGSLKCDCGPQLNGALSQMGELGAGVLLYLNQEGRGIGLANKMRAYSLQNQGFDTVEANHRLGFEDDERNFDIGSEILKKLGFSKVRLLTNNPAKIQRLEKTGIQVVERVPLKVGRNVHSENYLNVKSSKSGHLL